MTKLGGFRTDLADAQMTARPRESATETVLKGLVAMEAADPEYVERMFLQRAGRDAHGAPNAEAAGSIYPDLTPRELRERFREAEWSPFEHPAIMNGCKAFAAAIPGRMGIVDLETLPADTIVTLDDRKSIGKASATVSGVQGAEVQYTIAILGPNDKTGELELWTFHPGAPIAPSILAIENRHGERISIAEARSLGFDKAKIVKE